MEIASFLGTSPKFVLSDFQGYHHHAVDRYAAVSTVFNHNPKARLSCSDIMTCESWTIITALTGRQWLQRAVTEMGFNVGDSWYQRSVNCSAMQRNHQNNDHFSLYPLPCLFEEKSP